MNRRNVAMTTAITAVVIALVATVVDGRHLLLRIAAGLLLLVGAAKLVGNWTSARARMAGPSVRTESDRHEIRADHAGVDVLMPSLGQGVESAVVMYWV